MADLRCPAWLGPKSNWLCDRKAEYQISGTRLCQHHALSVQNKSAWKKWFARLQVMENDYEDIPSH